MGGAFTYQIPCCSLTKTRLLWLAPGPNCRTKDWKIHSLTRWENNPFPRRWWSPRTGSCDSKLVSSSEGMSLLAWWSRKSLVWIRIPNAWPPHLLWTMHIHVQRRRTFFETRNNRSQKITVGMWSTSGKVVGAAGHYWKWLWEGQEWLDGGSVSSLSFLLSLSDHPIMSWHVWPCSLSHNSSDPHAPPHLQQRVSSWSCIIVVMTNNF